MSFSLKILGSNSATPAFGRHHTAQLLSVQKHNFLIDCGEGTQERLIKYKNKPFNINHIFISHLHGDHYLGLMGLIFSMHLMRRTADLYVYAQHGLQEIITTQLKYSNSPLNYKIIFRELKPGESELLFEDELISVHSFPLVHRIPCSGFLFREKPKSIRLNKELLPDKISLADIGTLKKGEDLIDDNGNVLYKNSDLTFPPRKSRSYAFCSDTRYEEGLISYIKNVDLLYHETTFLDEGKEWAELTFHSTTKQAAEIAKKANAERLLIGHFSARYRDLSPFLAEAKEVFEGSYLATEGETFEVKE